MNDQSGSGVAFTRNPSTGENAFYGEYLSNCEGEDVVSGSRDPMTLVGLRNRQPAVYGSLIHVCALLEKHFRDTQVNTGA